MANTDRAYGFEPTGIMYGLQPYEKDVGGAGILYRNDLMEIESDGNVIPAAAASVDIVGSAQGVAAGGTGGISTATKALSATVTATTVLGTWDPNQMYWAQDDASGTPAQTDIGGSADHIAGGGSTATGISGFEIAISTTDSAADGIRLLDFVRRPDNSIGVNADWMCLINEHTMSKEAGV